MKSGNLNFLESSGPVQACNGTAFITYKTVYSPTSQRINTDTVIKINLLPLFREITAVNCEHNTKYVILLPGEI